MTLGSLKRTIVEWIESVELWKVLPYLKTLAISLPLGSIIISKYNSSFPNERVQNTVNQHVSNNLTFIISKNTVNL